jgi:glucoside 3-dehydrogenase (cytochrome c) hitch-hiker subunit
MDAQGVNRREALRRLAVGGAATAALPSWVETLSAFALDHAHTHGQRAAAAKTAAAWKPKVLTPHQNSTVITLTELIIPQTDTPGAKAANVNRFIDGVLAEGPVAERTKLLAGITAIDERSKTEFGKPFVDATPDQQTALLTKLSTAPVDEFFEAIKSMTIIGYYTSEVGMRQEMGDDGTLFFAEFKGCEHPEHRDG